MFLEMLLIRSFFTSSAKFKEFDAGNVILFEIKVIGRNIKEDYASTLFHKNNCVP